MQYRITFTVGLGVDEFGMDIDPIDRPIIIRQLREYMADNFGGATFLSGYGIWNGGPNNATVGEPVAHIIVDAWVYAVEQVKDHAKNMATIARQNAVHMSMAAMYACDITNTGVCTDGS